MKVSGKSVGDDIFRARFVWKMSGLNCSIIKCQKRRQREENFDQVLVDCQDAHPVSKENKAFSDGKSFLIANRVVALGKGESTSVESDGVLVTLNVYQDNNVTQLAFTCICFKVKRQVRTRKVE